MISAQTFSFMILPETVNCFRLNEEGEIVWTEKMSMILFAELKHRCLSTIL